MDYKALSGKPVTHLYQAHTGLRQAEIAPQLLALAELRTSQLNGCAYCCAFHAQELREMGIAQEQLDKLPGHQHSTAFTVKQALVIRWSEAVTLLQEDVEPLKAALCDHFTDKELVDLTTSIALMNALNRLRIVLGEKV